ncbi:unnamed protein product, partial [Rotaria sordida]
MTPPDERALDESLKEITEDDNPTSDQYVRLEEQSDVANDQQ